MIRNLWFLDSRVVIRVSHEDGRDQLSVLEQWAPMGDSPPLHLHQNQDEIFHLIDGEFRFRVGDEERRFVAGDTLIAPKGTPHTYRIESAGGGHWLVVTHGRDFEDFVRAFGRPAARDSLPETSGPPTPEHAEALSQACLKYGIQIVGPPLT